MSAIAVPAARRGAFEVMRRGIDNSIANWPLIGIRVCEIVFFGIIAIAGAIAAVAPILVSVGIELSKITTTEEIEDAMLALMQRWMLLVWVIVAFLALVVIFIAVHAFVEAGSARVYFDGERAAGPAMLGARSRFRAFSMERWLAGGREGWWTLFWIYNLAWSVAALFLLIPLLPTIAGMLLLREKPAVAVATGCVGLALTGMLLIFVGSVTGMWVNRSVNEWAAHRLGARAALAAGWSAFRADLGRHLLIFIATFIVAMAASSFLTGFSMMAGVGEAFGGNHGLFPLFMVPLRLAGLLANSVFSSAVSAWYLASYTALAAE